jgi:hypothetical protein
VHYDLSAVIPAFVGGLTGGMFAIIGMIVSGRRERHRTDRDQELSAVLAAQQCLMAIEDLHATHRDDDGDLSAEGEFRSEALLRELRASVVAIRKPVYRDALDAVAQVLQHHGIRLMFPDSGRQITTNACRYGHAVIAAYRVDREPPPLPERLAGYRESQREQEAIWEQEDIEREQERLQRREARRLAAAQQVAPPDEERPIGDPPAADLAAESDGDSSSLVSRN